MSALKAIDAALFAALAALEHDGTPSAEQPFARVARGWAPVDAEILRLLSPQTPGLILLWGGAQPQPVPGTDTILGAEQPESRSPEEWTALVALEEPRSLDDAVQGASSSPGMLDLVDAVLAAVNGLAVAGLWQGRRVRVTRYGPDPKLSARGAAVVAAVGIVAERTTPHVVDAAPEDAAPLEQMEGELGPPDALFNEAHVDTT